MDKLSFKERSRNMSRVKSRDTKPEKLVRRLVYSMGYRYRLHLKNLPGSPDLAFLGKRKAIFVHGCFWHQHSGCPNCRIPKTRQDFWISKLKSNKENDKKVLQKLSELGWEVMIIWECELANKDTVISKLTTFLGDK